MSQGFKEKAKKYFWNNLVSLDQMCNTLLGGDPDETMSSRMGKSIAEGRCKFCGVICWVLNKIDPNHCATSIELDEGSKSISTADQVFGKVADAASAVANAEAKNVESASPVPAKGSTDA